MDQKRSRRCAEYYAIAARQIHDLCRQVPGCRPKSAHRHRGWFRRQAAKRLAGGCHAQSTRQRATARTASRQEWLCADSTCFAAQRHAATRLPWPQRVQAAARDSAPAMESCMESGCRSRPATRRKTPDSDKGETCAFRADEETRCRQARPAIRPTSRR